MRSKLLHTFLLTFLYSSLASVALAKEAASPREAHSAEPAQAIRLTIDLDHPQPLSQDLYGANTEAMHLPVWFDQPAFAEKYKAIGRPFLRFPGGTSSNFYNPQSGLFDNDSPSDREYGPQNKRLLKITNGAGRKPEPFFRFAREQDLRYSLVLNVCTQTFEQNKAWLERIAEAGHRVPAIEIGNEVFFGSYKWAFPTPADYMERSRKLTEVIRKLFPATKVGVVFPIQLYQDKTFVKHGERPKPSSQYQWMIVLEGEAFYDALAVHLYSQVGMSNATKPADFIPHLEGYANVMSMLENRLDPTFDELKKRFPGKELWITEYGVGGFGGDLKQYTLRYSHLGALHTDLMLLRFTRNPSVTIAHWHSYNHFFDATEDGKRFEDQGNLTFTHFSLFRDPIRNCDAVVPVKTTAASTDIEAFVFTGKGKSYLMVVNKQGREHTVGEVSLLSSGAPSTAKLAGGVQLLHRTDMPLEKAMQDTERCERVPMSPAQLESLKLPPYSITQLEIKTP